MERWAGFEEGTLARNRRNGMAYPSTPKSNATSQMRYGDSFLNGTTTNAKPVAPPVKTSFTCITSSSVVRAATTLKPISLSSASDATTPYIVDFSTLSGLNGDADTGPSSVGVCHVGDALDRLKALRSESVQCIVTSPPYFNLRDYKVSGQLGHEATLQEYVAKFVAIMAEARRVLRSDGVCWVVLGDSYVRDGGRRKVPDTACRSQSLDAYNENRQKPQRLAQKQLMGMPWRVALAMQDDGWWLRNDVIWQKPNPIPESVYDRSARSHEYIFMFTKSERYFFDHEAIKEPSVSGASDRRKMQEGKDRITAKHLSDVTTGNAAEPRSNVGRKRAVGDGVLRHSRSVWTIASTPYRGVHFATFPKALAERCILASTSPWACGICAKPLKRVMGDKQVAAGRGSGQVDRKFRSDHGGVDVGGRGHLGIGVPWQPTTRATASWAPQCRCLEHFGFPKGGTEPLTQRCVVLDPFAGAMTTAIVAETLGRDFVGVELNPTYVVQGAERILKERTKRAKVRKPRKDTK